MLAAKAKDQGHKRKCFSKKKFFKKVFQAISKTKTNRKTGLQKIFCRRSPQKRLAKIFSADLQNFNHSKNNAVLEPRTGQFSRT